MIIQKNFGLLAFSFFFFVNLAISQTENKAGELNVLTYKTNLQPDLEKKYIQGDVTISFLLDPNINEVIFNSGSLEVTAVIGEAVVDHVQQDKKVIISLADRATNKNQVQIFYNGKPPRGFVFPEPGQAHSQIYRLSFFRSLSKTSAAFH